MTSMHLFRPYTFTWIEIGIFKAAMLAIGLALGGYFYEIVREYMIAVIGVAVLTSAYVGYVALQQAIAEKVT